MVGAYTIQFTSPGSVPVHLNKLAKDGCYQITNVASSMLLYTMTSLHIASYLSASGFHTTFEQVNDVGDATDDEENPG